MTDTVVSYQITTTADDVSNGSAMGGFITSGVAQGYYAGMVYAGVRFPGVAVPKGATITSATLTFVTGGFFGGGSGSSLGTLQGVASDDAPAWTTQGPETGSRTTASTPFLGNTSAAVTINHDVRAIVQEIISRAGWVSGHALAFAGDPTNATDYCSFQDYSDSTSQAAKLSISYNTTPTFTTATKFATTGASLTSGAGTAWTNPTRVTASDNSRATAALSGAGSSSRTLRARSFGFTTSDIPTGSTIVGIEIFIERSQSGVAAVDSVVKLSINNAGTEADEVGSNKSAGAVWVTTEAITTFGSSIDSWGASLTDTQVRAATFGVDFKVTTSASSTLSVDAVSCRITYTAGASSAKPTVRVIFIG